MSLRVSGARPSPESGLEAIVERGGDTYHPNSIHPMSRKRVRCNDQREYQEELLVYP